MADMKPLRWVGDAKERLLEFPDAMRKDIGYALHFAQMGDKHPSAKPLKGFGGAGVLEVVESHDGDAFRAVYTVKVAGAVYVLRCFQKKSRRGIATSQADIALIRKRLVAAQTHHAGRNS
ncbi:MAG: addiction module toxin RelE [Alphaproteobacteria bacterium]|nr:addiction module toxin RelE [Alphaproteobacteria bacterium]